MKNIMKNEAPASSVKQRPAVSNGMNYTRRKFLKIMLVGSAALLAERVVSSLYSWFFSHSSVNNPSKTNSLKTNSLAKPPRLYYGDFRIVKTGNGLSIYDPAGEEIFQIDEGV